ncbi:MAG: Fic family protein [Thermodesulfobacteriota bacterium]|nr:Fic family protein [Thermodesulfobacteriota bacterium]
MTQENCTPPYTITPPMLQAIEQIGEWLGRLDVATPALVTPHLRRNNRIKTIQASLEIEGNSLNLEQVTAVLDGKRVLGSMREVQEVHNAFQAYEKLESWNPSEMKDLRAAHGILMHGLEEGSGHFRTGSVGIKRGADVIHIAPPAERVPQLMTELLDWLATTDEHPLIAGSVFHYEFEFIHPFMDGNGRLGRLWQTLILSRWKPVFGLLPIESIIRDQQEDYYQSLRNADQTGDSTLFVEFMLRAILNALMSTAFVTDQVADQVSDQVKKLLQALASRPQKAMELMAEFGLSHRPTFRKNYLQPALKAGLIEMTQPEKPQSSNQHYRITARGGRFVTVEYSLMQLITNI